MNTLNWRKAREIRLTERLIPDPNSPSQNLAVLREVNVAFDGALVHIDPRPENAPDHDPANPEFDVYVIPATAVQVIHYMEQKPKQRSSKMTVFS